MLAEASAKHFIILRIHAEPGIKRDVSRVNGDIASKDRVL